MAKLSAGILMYRLTKDGPEFLLVHPGGPFFAKKDLGSWTIPKGEPADGEDMLAAARREFREETGHDPAGPFAQLTPVKQKGGKVVHAYATRGELDPGAIVSNEFELEWPPRSGKLQRFPEIDRAQFFAADEARKRINPAQIGLLDELLGQL